jgi:hypothetical protein
MKESVINGYQNEIDLKSMSGMTHHILECAIRYFLKHNMSFEMLIKYILK